MNGQTPKVARRRVDILKPANTHPKHFRDQTHTNINKWGGLLMYTEMDWEEGWESFEATRATT